MHTRTRTLAHMNARTATHVNWISIARLIYGVSYLISIYFVRIYICLILLLLHSFAHSLTWWCVRGPQFVYINFIYLCLHSTFYVCVVTPTTIPLYSEFSLFVCVFFSHEIFGFIDFRSFFSHIFSSVCVCLHVTTERLNERKTFKRKMKIETYCNRNSNM